MAKHKSREKTRANRRKKYLPNNDRPKTQPNKSKRILIDDEKLNIRSPYGYNDPTPYFAFKNIEREQKAASA
jgi:hypothetical protein